jgi:hypothetical protein
MSTNIPIMNYIVPWLPHKKQRESRECRSCCQRVWSVRYPYNNTEWISATFLPALLSADQMTHDRSRQTRLGYRRCRDSTTNQCCENCQKCYFFISLDVIYVSLTHLSCPAVSHCNNATLVSYLGTNLLTIFNVQCVDV